MPPRKAKASKRTKKTDTAEGDEPTEKRDHKTDEAGTDEPAKKKAKKTKAVDEDASAGESDQPKVKNGKKVQPQVSVDDSDFTSEAKTTDGCKWNLKFASWNVNGIRAWLDKGGPSYITKEDPDIFCVQETKCNSKTIPDKCKVDGYHTYWASADQEGYSGVGLYCKEKPVNVDYGIGISKHDKEGRVITAEFKKFFMVTAYVPNSGRGLPRLAYRTKEWDVDFTAYLKKLDEKKPVVLCGDLNVAHLDIDLKNPKSNKKTAGFTKEEREGFTNLLKEGFFDSFRELYPELEGAYTFWAYFMNNRAKDVGWRLDYFIVSEKLKKHMCDSIIRKRVMGSDHCPIVLLMNM
ncbi:DNA-(apurinic or apyrimidinic site) endonuclease-like [Gigantopelta aegis]|uniref:DNA-(apurinic or apyrimidinic site) endonuclease-like n=1 Tax=Gigantopelta aegis TaxID=1735272 RepID=UPI001B88DD25|nr:DNA-(apurinic or apyrimidinic site) endonuclease-like [Gigantopelta aegis]